MENLVLTEFLREKLCKELEKLESYITRAQLLGICEENSKLRKENQE